MNKQRSFSKGLLVGIIAAIAVPALAATFQYFSPANGILKGNASTYVTTAATSTDVVGIFSGTCDATTFLRGDGSCNTPAGTGVTSVGLTMPTGFSVSGSPVTSSGTLGVTTTLSGVLHGNGSGFTASNVALGSEVTGTLPVANGGTGAATLTGPLKGNGTSALTAAASSDIIGLWTGTCSSGTFLRGDGSCQSPGSGSPGGSNTQIQYNDSGSFAGASALTYTSGSSTFAASGPVVFSSSYSGAGLQALRLSATTPALAWNETGAASNTKLWDALPLSGVLTFRVTNDAENSFSNWMTVKRSGATVAGVTFPGAIGTPASGTSGITLGVQGAGGSITFAASGGATNGKLWDVVNNPANTLDFRAVNDTYTAATSYLTITKSATAIATISLGNAADNPTVTINGQPPGRGIVSTNGVSGGGLMQIGDTVTLYSGTATSRASNTTLSADPNLQINNLPLGNYLIRVHFDVSMGAGGVKYTITAAGNSASLLGTEMCDTTGSVKRLISLTANTCAGTSSATWSGQGIVRSNGGTISVDWAQNSSSGTNTTVTQFSFMELTRIT